MRLAVVLWDEPAGPRQGPPLDALLPGAGAARREVTPAGWPSAAGWLALLGQEPLAAWTGPAPFLAASAGIELSPDETAYVLSPVRVEDGVVVAAPAAHRSRLEAACEHLREALADEPLSVVAGPAGLVLIVPEPAVGPAAPCAAPLVGRRLDAPPAGPPVLLERVIARSREAWAEVGGPATHFFPHTPGGPPQVRPLREAWLGLGPSVVVGEARGSGEARALATLLRLDLAPVAADPLGAALAEAWADLALVVTRGAPDPGALARLADAAGALALVRAAAGRAELVWRARSQPAALAERDPLRALLRDEG